MQRVNWPNAEPRRPCQLKVLSLALSVTLQSLTTAEVPERAGYQCGGLLLSSTDALPLSVVLIRLEFTTGIRTSGVRLLIDVSVLFIG